MVERMKNPQREVSIGLVGKYVEYEDSYKSLKEALLHAGIAHQAKRQHRVDRIRSRWSGPPVVITCSASTAFWFPAASASAASEAC